MTADTAAALIRPVRPRSTAGRAQRALAKDLINEVRRLDHRIATATDQIAATLTELYRLGTVLAGRIRAHTGPIERFRSAAAFASYTGTAPIEISSGDVVRHRLSRAGDRQLNACLHIMAITQIRLFRHPANMDETACPRRNGVSSGLCRERCFRPDTPGVMSGGMGTDSDDIGRCESAEE